MTEGSSPTRESTGEIGVLATGPRVEKRLARESEMNANTLVPAQDVPDLPVLVRRFASEGVPGIDARLIRITC